MQYKKNVNVFYINADDSDDDNPNTSRAYDPETNTIYSMPSTFRTNDTNSLDGSDYTGGYGDGGRSMYSEPVGRSGARGGPLSENNMNSGNGFNVPKGNKVVPYSDPGVRNNTASQKFRKAVRKVGLANLFRPKRTALQSIVEYDPKTDPDTTNIAPPGFHKSSSAPNLKRNNSLNNGSNRPNNGDTSSLPTTPEVDPELPILNRKWDTKHGIGLPNTSSGVDSNKSAGMKKSSSSNDVNPHKHPTFKAAGNMVISGLVFSNRKKTQRGPDWDLIDGKPDTVRGPLAYPSSPNPKVKRLSVISDTDVFSTDNKPTTDGDGEATNKRPRGGSLPVTTRSEADVFGDNMAVTDSLLTYRDGPGRTSLTNIYKT